MSGYYQAVLPLNVQPKQRKGKSKSMSDKKTKEATDCSIWLMVRSKGAKRTRGGITFTQNNKVVAVTDLNNSYQGDEPDVEFVTLENAKRIYRDPQLVIVKSQSTELLEG